MSRAEKKPDEARRFQGEYVEAHIKASTFWLELGHLRRLLAQVEGLPDDAEVTFGGFSKSLRESEYHAKEAQVRHRRASV